MNAEQSLERSRSLARASQARYRAANPEKVLERARKWRADHPGRSAEAQRRWRVKNIEKARASGRAAYRKTADKQRDLKLRRVFGIDAAQYEQMLANQSGACAICHGVNKSGMRLHVDHCHDSGKIRGLLCSNCNRGIGHLQDSEDVLAKAIAYLRASR